MGRHLAQRLLESLLSQATPPSHDLVHDLVLHLVELCAECRAEFELAREAIVQQLDDRHGREARKLVERLFSEGLNLRRIRREARQDLRTLLKLEPAARRLRVERSLQRFRSPVLVDLVIEESRTHLSSDPHLALDLVECAQAVALKVPHALYGSAWTMTVMARALAYRGNALRVLGDLQEASSWLESAIELFELEGDHDPMVSAELISLLGTLRLNQARYTEADEHFTRSLALYQEIEDSTHAARVLIKRGRLLSDMDRPLEAISALQEALSLIEPEKETLHFLSAVHTLARQMRDVGDYEAAREVVTSNRDLYEQFAADSLIQLRRAWLESTIAHGLGRLDEAEAGLIAVRRGFGRDGLGYDAALAGLDLALIYVDKGEPEAVRSLAREMVPIFLAQDIHREATAALMMFQEAARQEAVTTEMVRELSRYLRRIRARPPEQPS